MSNIEENKDHQYPVEEIVDYYTSAKKRSSSNRKIKRYCDKVIVGLKKLKDMKVLTISFNEVEAMVKRGDADKKAECKKKEAQEAIGATELGEDAWVSFENPDRKKEKDNKDNLLVQFFQAYRIDNNLPMGEKKRIMLATPGIESYNNAYDHYIDFVDKIKLDT